MPHGGGVVSEVVARLAEREVHALAPDVGQRLIVEQGGHLLDRRLILRRHALGHSDIEIGGGGLVRASFRGRFEQRDRLVEPTFFPQDRGQEALCLPARGEPFGGVFQERYGLGPIAFVQKDLGAADAARHRIGPELGHPAVALDRLFALVVVFKKDAEPFQRLGVPWIERDRALERADGLGVAPHLRQRPAEVVVVLGDTRCEADGLRRAASGVLGSARVQVDRPQRRMGCGVCGVVLRIPLRQARRFHEPAGVAQAADLLYLARRSSLHRRRSGGRRRLAGATMFVLAAAAARAGIISSSISC